MKKIIAITLILMVILLAGGCKKANSTVVAPSNGGAAQDSGSAASTADSGTADSGTADSGTADSGTADSGTADSGSDSVDSGTADSGTSSTGGSASASSPEKTKIDLTVVDAYFSPSFIDQGEETTLKIILKNQGVEDAGIVEYNIKIMKDSSVMKEDKLTIDSLKRGVQEKVSKDYAFASPGSYSAEVYIDPDNKIRELTETNNYMKSKADAVVS